MAYSGQAHHTFLAAVFAFLARPSQPTVSQLPPRAISIASWPASNSRFGTMHKSPSPPRRQLTSPHFTSLQDRFRLPAKPSFPTRASISKNSQPIKPWRCLKTSAASCRPPKRSSESYRPTADQAFDPTRRKKQRTPGPCRRRRRRTTAARGTGRAACTGATSAPARSA